MHHSMHSRLGRGDGVQLRAEEVDPEVPVHGNPQEPLADATKVAACEIALGAKL
jgi:hypothetical protein